MTDDELTGAILSAVAEAVHGELERGLPVHPNLSPEWRLAVTYSTGVVITYDHETEAEAREVAGRLHASSVVQHRLVSAWKDVPRPAPAPVSHGVNDDDGGELAS